MKYAIGFIAAVICFVFCNATYSPVENRLCKEVIVNGHTYITYGYSNQGVAICPSAETLRWAYSQRTTGASVNGDSAGE